MARIIKTTFKVKRGSKERWEEVNPILAAGEPGCELDTHKLKVGDGSTAWNDLPYVGHYNGPTVDTDLSEYVTKVELAAQLEGYLKRAGVATSEGLGLVKSSQKENQIRVNQDGTMELNEVNINRLVQNDGDTIILQGN